MKKTYLILAAFMGMATLACSQEHRSPDGGGSYTEPYTTCITPEEHQRIEVMLQENIARLKTSGQLQANWGADNKEPGVIRKPTAGTFLWPLKQQPNFNYNSYYGISNYVDLNPAFPNQVMDYNCGGRTYDQAQGYNHQGIDIFLWPFPQRMQDAGQVAIIAAADGIVIGKDDGNFDKNCALDGDQWNAVYVGNSDGTICWYGHMKNGSLTTKQIGQTVTAGEYLGLVGSSGNSTGPHLHFETHDAVGNIIEPYAGPCNPGQASLWLNQKPYIDPTINAVMTHSAVPVFPSCPQLETINSKDDFVTGDAVHFAVYFHDQVSTNTGSYKLYKPDNTEFDSWTAASSVPHYSASYWYWVKTVTAAWPAGTWRFEVTYNGVTVSHNFTVNGSTGLSNRYTAKAGFSIYPNPNSGQFTLKVPEGVTVETIKLLDITGKVLVTQKHRQAVENYVFDTKLSKGLYLLKLELDNGAPMVLRFVVR